MRTKHLVIAAIAIALVAGVAAVAVHVAPDPVAAVLLQSKIYLAVLVGGSPLLLMANALAVPVTSKKIRDLQTEKTKLVSSMRAIVDEATKASRDFTAEEQTRYDELKAQLEAKNKAIAREADLIAEEAALGAAHLPDGTISVTENVEKDGKRGFRSLGDFAQAVRRAGQPGSRIDERLVIGNGIAASVPTTFSNESSGTDGGFALPPDYSTEIWRLSLAEGSLLPFTSNTEVGGNSMVFPKDETTPWGGSGVQAYWRSEAAAFNQSKVALGADALRLHELIVLCPVTNELLDDGVALGSYLQPLAGERIMWKANEAILFGTGVGQPLGCLSPNAGALVVVAKEAGQATATLAQANISKMRSRLKTGELKNAIWLGQPDLLPVLEGLTVGNIPIFLPPTTGIREAYDGSLNGRPLILSEHAAAFSSQSDISLLALNGYRTITKAGGIQSATSMHLYFDANAMAYRFIFRIDGKPIIKAPITPPAGKSANTRSYFVTLAAR